MLWLGLSFAYILNYSKRSTTLNQPFAADSDERKVTISLLENVLSQFEGRGGARDAIEVISAFKAPLCLYDPIRKLFHHSTKPRKIFADALVSCSTEYQLQSYDCFVSQPAVVKENETIISTLPSPRSFQVTFVIILLSQFCRARHSFT